MLTCLAVYRQAVIGQKRERGTISGLACAASPGATSAR